MATYNGHKNWAYWNVALWISNDYGLYTMARSECRYNDRRQAARNIVHTLADAGITKTPDGARYTYSAVRAALAGLE